MQRSRGANSNDHKLLKGTLDSIPIARPEPSEEAPQAICLDKAYDNAETRDTTADYDLMPHIRARAARRSRARPTSRGGGRGAGSSRPATRG